MMTVCSADICRSVIGKQREEIKMAYSKQYLQRLEEISNMKIPAHMRTTLQMKAIFDEINITYDEIKEEILNDNKRNTI